jgi:UDP-N-acetylglucosamine 4-epimerase
VVHANQAAALAQGENVTATAYNIAFGERTTLNELFTMLRQNLSAYDPAIASIVPVYAAERPGDIPHSLASIEKAGKTCDILLNSPLKQGLRMATLWYWENI